MLDMNGVTKKTRVTSSFVLKVTIVGSLGVSGTFRISLVEKDPS